MHLKSSHILMGRLLTFIVSSHQLVMEVKGPNFIFMVLIESLIWVLTKIKAMFMEFILETVFVPGLESSKIKSVQMELNLFNVIKLPYKRQESMKCQNICSLVDPQVIHGLTKLQLTINKNSNS